MKEYSVHEMTRVLNRAQETYGYQVQLNVAAEECCELAAVCMKYIRYHDHEEAKKALKPKLVEEIADVIVGLQNLYLMFNITPDDVEKQITYKLNRLESWLNSSPDIQATTLNRQNKSCSTCITPHNHGYKVCVDCAEGNNWVPREVGQ